MRQADAFDSTLHRENLSRILHRAMQLAELAGNEQDAEMRCLPTAWPVLQRTSVACDREVSHTQMPQWGVRQQYSHLRHQQRIK
jgi:hypothetical protein